VERCVRLASKGEGDLARENRICPLDKCPRRGRRYLNDEKKNLEFVRGKKKGGSSVFRLTSSL